MLIGMLWFDNDPKTSLVAKIERAAEFHHKKYGAAADECHVNSTDLIDCDVLPDKVRVVMDSMIMPGHLWMGLEEKT